MVCSGSSYRVRGGGGGCDGGGSDVVLVVVLLLVMMVGLGGCVVVLVAVVMVMVMTDFVVVLVVVLRSSLVKVGEDDAGDGVDQSPGGQIELILCDTQHGITQHALEHNMRTH